MDEASIRQLKVVELKAELQKLGLPTGGKKEDLQTRLIDAIASKKVPSRSTTPEKPSTITSSSTTTTPQNRLSEKPNSTVVKSTNLSPLQTWALPEDDESNKRSSRAARFNIEPTEEVRKQRRQNRFGSLETDLLDTEKLRARQERFGVVTSKRLETLELEEQKIKRLQRFGLGNSK